MRQLLAGGVPGQRVVVGGVKGGKYAPLPVEIHKNDAKNRQFPILFGLKIAINAICCSKVLNKISSQDIFLGKH